jgi:3-oxo-5-alpha-steroid 4-dehydrogenase 1
MFDYVSGANFFGEIIEWTGFAIACNLQLPAVAFAAFTALNIGPRALQHHKDYLRRFSGESKDKPLYPADRKALIPFLL